MWKIDKVSKAFIAVFVAAWTAILTCVAAYVTHVVWVVETLLADEEATVGQIVLAVAGSIIPPIGAVHGVVLWF